MKALLISCTLYLFSIYATNGQAIHLTGTDICSAGSNSTSIGLTNADTAKYYALYHNGVQQVICKFKIEGKIKAILFGDYSQPGIYSAIQFDHFDSIPDPKYGKTIPGEVKIKQSPIISIPSEIVEIHSGDFFNYLPQTNMSNVEIIWTATLLEGKLTKFYEKGRGTIMLPFDLQGNQPAIIKFSFMPVAPEASGSCVGTIRKVTLRVLPIKP